MDKWNLYVVWMLISYHFSIYINHFSCLSSETESIQFFCLQYSISFRRVYKLEFVFIKLLKMLVLCFEIVDLLYQFSEQQCCKASFWTFELNWLWIWLLLILVDKRINWQNLGCNFRKLKCFFLQKRLSSNFIEPLEWNVIFKSL